MAEFHPLSDRQERILAMVVHSYIESGKPVGSKTLVEGFGLDVSSATVRNDLALLGDLGYVAQLHTSAGRIPTETGYRYFVQKLLGEFHLPLHEREMIRHQFHQARLELEQWMRLSAAILARTARSASFVTATCASRSPTSARCAAPTACRPRACPGSPSSRFSPRTKSSGSSGLPPRRESKRSG